MFTDVQKSSLPPSFSDLKLDDGTKLEIHPVASAPVPNWTVENVEAPRRVFDTKKVRTVATIAGYGTVDAVRKVTLLANGKPLETKQVKVPANGRATVEFLTLDAPYGLTRCEVQIDSADAFPQDDHWLFSVERADPKPALLVHADGDTASPLYVRTALESSTEAAFTLESLPTNQAANANVSKYAFVILSDPGPLPQKLEDALEKYVQGGGSVLMTLGKNATPGRHLPIADLQVMGLHTVDPEREAPLTVASVDTSYPAFSRAQNWGGVEFYQAAKLQLPQASPETRVAATLSDGSPLFIDRQIGDRVTRWCSRRLSTTSPTICRWSRSGCRSSIRRRTRWAASGRRPGTTRWDRLSNCARRGKKAFRLRSSGPGDKRLLSLAESTKARTFQFPSQGFFDIRRANGREELASVNADRRESDFALVPAETLELWKNTGIASKSGQSSTSSAASADQRDDKAEIWSWVLAMLAVLAIAESVLGNRHMSAAAEVAE